MELFTGPAAQSRHHLWTVSTTAEGTPFWEPWTRCSVTSLPSLRHDVQLTGDLLGVNHPLFVSQHGQLSHSSSWGGNMSSKLYYAAPVSCSLGGYSWWPRLGNALRQIWCCLQVALCDPYLSVAVDRTVYN